jgi:hypothetical protein
MSKAKSKKSSSHGTLADCPVLLGAVEEFVRANNHFDSSFPVNAALEEMAKCTTLLEIFELPLKHKLFTMEAALHWALFLKLAPDRAEEEGDTTSPSGVTYSADKAFDIIKTVYDIGVQNAVWEHFEADDDDDDEDGEDDEDDDAAAKSKKKGSK